jgi:hypothetical protein
MPSAEALRGALEVVRAKHSNWPPNKLKYLRSGAGILDEVVERNPDNPEVRYLRLVSFFYLPSLLRRDDSVEEDFRALIGLLPKGPGPLPPLLHQQVTLFVLENGEVKSEDRTTLEGLLR